MGSNAKSQSFGIVHLILYCLIEYVIVLISDLPISTVI